MRAILCIAMVIGSSPALAQVPLIGGMGGPSGYGTECLSPNDDGSSAEIDVRAAFPDGLEFFGTIYYSVYVNTNGNITFNGALDQYTPDAFPIAAQPMIAPYWGDVDIRGVDPFCDDFGGDAGCMNDGGPNGVWWHLEPGRMVVTWDRVGYYDCHDSRQMSFQLILRQPELCGTPNDFEVEFRYNLCEWEAGEASGDDDGNGLCDAGEDCTPAQVGFDAGNEMDFVSLPESRMPGIRNVVCGDSNVGVPGIWRFGVRGGAVECPDANTPCPIPGGVGVCGEGRTECVGASTACRVVHEPSAERCDGLDNDCNGESDEGALCTDPQVCVRGRCIDRCSEFGCPPGESCDAELGVCTEDACEGVTCDAGLRCVGGTCRSVCEDIVCPAHQTCSGGQCVDACEGADCGACRVCVDGSCLLHCAVVGCPTGLACEETGECVEEACLGVRCGPGRTCRAGVCASSCAGAVCPPGEYCTMGECVIGTAPMPDAGPPDPDAGMPDAGMDEVPDAGMGSFDAGAEPDAGTIGGGDGCGCRAAGDARAPWLLLLGLVFLLRRGRS